LDGGCLRYSRCSKQKNGAVEEPTTHLKTIGFGALSVIWAEPVGEDGRVHSTSTVKGSRTQWGSATPYNTVQLPSCSMTSALKDYIQIRHKRMAQIPTSQATAKL